MIVLIHSRFKSRATYTRPSRYVHLSCSTIHSLSLSCFQSKSTIPLISRLLLLKIEKLFLPLKPLFRYSPIIIAPETLNFLCFFFCFFLRVW
ncbi:hypothetical protein RIF29_16483 [Crotalaria pallida]|uniref:Uncharacterized protein n=1 Tax=Crotalaria pallida TaxID=3830 RepID=A0AAN9FF56_CROPI